MPNTRMLINYVPGEECRVAIVEDGKLEEFHAESADAVSKVGNIYVGVVANVEPAIQAAFIDFGLPQHGFLHVTDVHPKYFPGAKDDVERVGKKTPRRDRPPIQQCFRRGQEVAVQVLKEGHGTKGPTVTSYLSIPGRFLVMMPDMDRVGVSRKVEDEDQRRQMREILDKLDLPEGFGFILRTAGFDRNKTELKRDLAYLLRLWKDIEERERTGRGHRLLYTESDLLVRALRDFLTGDINEVVIDNEQALARASRFMKIVAPRAQLSLKQYTGSVPLFHAFGVEEQILNIHAREIPLASGGRLVIDETEALIAIDVNSGKSRQARDAETNAFNTNVEAVDEICRQLRLRDLGGLIINDLIDMRDPHHRRKIEQRMRDRLKRDRARTTILPISQFGILEMTRQRMRGSHESLHFADCPTCRGRGLLQRPDSVAADALRKLEIFIGHERVSRVEMVVAPRVAGEFLSHKRRRLTLLERRSGKHIDVRVSETLAADRVAFYAYDASGADLDVERLQAPGDAQASLKEWTGGVSEAWAQDLAEDDQPVDEEIPEVEQTHPIEQDIDDEDLSEHLTTGQKKKRRRRRRRRGKGGGEEPGEQAAAASAQVDEASGSGAEPVSGMESDGVSEPSKPDEPGQASSGPPARKKRRRRRRKPGVPASDQVQAVTQVSSESAAPVPVQQPADVATDGQAALPRKKRRRRGRRKPGEVGAGVPAVEGPQNGQAGPSPAVPAAVFAPPKRFLYATRRKLKPGERDKLLADE